MNSMPILTNDIIDEKESIDEKEQIPDAIFVKNDIIIVFNCVILEYKVYFRDL